MEGKLTQRRKGAKSQRKFLQEGGEANAKTERRKESFCKREGKLTQRRKGAKSQKIFARERGRSRKVAEAWGLSVQPHADFCVYPLCCDIAFQVMLGAEGEVPCPAQPVVHVECQGGP